MKEERFRAVVAITVEWLTRPVFDIDNVPVARGGKKIFGCGPFTVDSYHLFCKFDAEYQCISGDHNVVSFERWMKDKLKAKR